MYSFVGSCKGCTFFSLLSEVPFSDEARAFSRYKKKSQKASPHSSHHFGVSAVRLIFPSTSLSLSLPVASSLSLRRLWAYNLYSAASIFSPGPPLLPCHPCVLHFSLVTWFTLPFCPSWCFNLFHYFPALHPASNFLPQFSKCYCTEAACWTENV